jgi:hypothetical protein
MEDVTYTKGIYTAVASVRPMNAGQYQGLVSLARDDGEELENAVYEVEAASGTPEEARRSQGAGASYSWRARTVGRQRPLRAC